MSESGASACEQGRRWPPGLGVAVALAVAVAFLGSSALRWTSSGSVPRGLYRVVWRGLEPGDLVLVCLPEAVSRWAYSRGYVPAGSCVGGVAAIGKPIAAVAGDRVEVSERGIAVNGRWLEDSRRVDRDFMGRPVPVVEVGVRILGAGELWLHSGHHPRSLDSRVFGPARTPWVRRVLAPLWVEER